MSVNLDNLLEKFVVVFLFMIGFNVLGYGSYLIVILWLLLFVKTGIRLSCSVDANAIWLFLFLLSYAFFQALYSGDNTSYLSYFGFPFIFYLLGRKINFSGIAESMYSFVFAPIFGLSIWGIINIVYTRFNGDAALSAERMTIDFWSGEIMESSKEAAFFYLAACILGIIVWMKKLSVVDIALFAMMAIGIMHTGTRGVVLTFAAVCMIGFIYFSHTKAIETKIKNKTIRRLLLIMLILVIVLAVDLFGITTQITSSTFYLRMTGQFQNDSVDSIFDNNGRFKRYAAFFELAKSHPFGNFSLGDLGSAHNTFFDIYRVGGFIPCIMFIGFMCNSFWRVVRIVKAHGLDREDIRLICAIIMGMLIVFMVESMMGLNIHTMRIYFFYVGILASYEKNCNAKGTSKPRDQEL